MIPPIRQSGINMADATKLRPLETVESGNTKPTKMQMNSSGTSAPILIHSLKDGGFMIFFTER